MTMQGSGAVHSLVRFLAGFGSMTPVRPYRSWAEVPREPPQWARGRRLFVLEIFAGLAGLTLACSAIGLAVLPPVDCEVAGEVTAEVDVLDPEFQKKVR